MAWKGRVVEIVPEAQQGVPYGCPPRGEVVEVDNLGCLRVEFHDDVALRYAWFRKDEVATPSESNEPTEK